MKTRMVITGIVLRLLTPLETALMNYRLKYYRELRRNK